MTKKTLGYVQLEWTCPVCGKRNPGPQPTCSGCGSPQPEGAKFEAGADASLVKDEQELKRAQAAPDVHCPFCDARNPADAKVCKQCGGDLSEGAARASGQVVGALATGPAADVPCPTCGTKNPATALTCKSCGASLARPKPRPAVAAKQPQSRSCLTYVLVGVGLVVLAVIAYFVLANRTTDLSATVKEPTWTRSIVIEGLAPVERADWLDRIPEDATLGSCRQEVRQVVSEPAPNSKEVCGTPYTVDKGTGYAEVVQECKYEVYDQRCQYTVLEWQAVDTAVLRGAGLDARWPALNLGARQREGLRSENYECVLTANDETYVYTMDSVQDLSVCQPGSRWTLKVNTFNQVTDMEPVGD